jgi:hypothetical protein
LKLLQGQEDERKLLLILHTESIEAFLVGDLRVASTGRIMVFDSLDRT